MRRFLLTVFWISNVGNVLQLLFVVSASWIIIAGTYSFSELSVSVFFVQYVPWLLWLKAFVIALFGELGRWIFSLPILVVAPLKLIGGTVIGFWAYSVAMKMPIGPADAVIIDGPAR